LDFHKQYCLTRGPFCSFQWWFFAVTTNYSCILTINDGVICSFWSKLSLGRGLQFQLRSNLNYNMGRVSYHLIVLVFTKELVVYLSYVGILTLPIWLIILAFYGYGLQKDSINSHSFFKLGYELVVFQVLLIQGIREIQAFDYIPRPQLWRRYLVLWFLHLFFVAGDCHHVLAHKIEQIEYISKFKFFCNM